MSPAAEDDFRTRIAAAALNAYAGTETAWAMSEGDIRRKDWLEIADAVIRELDANYVVVPKPRTLADVLKTSKHQWSGITPQEQQG